MKKQRNKKYENKNQIKENILKIFLPGLCILAFAYVPAYIYLFLRNFNISDIDSQVLSDLIYIVIVVFLLRKSLREEFSSYKKNFKSYIKIGIKAYLIGITIMIISNIIINLLIFKGNIAGNEEAVRELLFKYPFHVVLASSIFAPIIEEITFRKMFKYSINTKWLLIITSGFAFGFLHSLTNISSYLSFLYIIPYGALGAVFAYMNHKTNSVFTSMTFHFLHNLITLILLLSFMNYMV